MVVHVQPSEGITLNLSAKIPGPTVRLGAVAMDFRYAGHFSRCPAPATKRCCMT